MILASEEHSNDSLLVASDHPQPVKAMQVRAKRQFGIGLSHPDEIVGIGVGPSDRPLKGKCAGSLPPTPRIGEEGEKLTLCDVDLEFAMAPGEMPDHMVVSHLEQKVLISGDNCFRSFPYLYAMRGTAYRNICAWADTTDVLMALEPENLDPGHIKPRTGVGAIKEVLTDCRDAIRHVVDVARNGMDEGMTIDEIAPPQNWPKTLPSRTLRPNVLCHEGLFGRNHGLA